MATKYASIDAYIATFADEVREVLEEVRRVIHASVPGSGESISYQMPTITLDGRSLVHFAAWKHHLGMYPLPIGDPELQRVLEPYRAGEGTARFRYRDPIPYDLIGQLAVTLVNERPVDAAVRRP